MNNKIFNDTAIVILLLSIVSIAGVHFYEIGSCRYFGIPTEYISFELNKYSYLLFSFLAALYLSALIFDALIGNIFHLTKVKNRYLRIIFLIMFFGLVIFSFK